MKKMFIYLKNVIRRIRRYFVLLYATRVYDKAINLADKIHEEKHTRAYVVITPSYNLVVLTRKSFRYCQRKLGFNPNSHIDDVKKGAIYFTADKSGLGIMCPTDISARRLWFLKNSLQRAGLK